MTPMLSVEPILCLDSALHGVSEILLQERSKDACSKLRCNSQGCLPSVGGQNKVRESTTQEGSSKTEQ